MAEDRRHVGAQAQRQAVSRLIDKYRSDYDKILGDEREGLGLPRDPTPAKKLSRLEILRQQLAEAGMTPKI